MEKKRVKKRGAFLTVSLVLVLALFLAGCSKGAEPAEVSEPEPTVVEEPEPADVEESEPADTTAGTDEPADSGTDEPAAPGTDDSSDPGDFDVSDPKWNWINWDADGDGTEEEIEFEYEDQGDEAPSFIAVTLYKGSGEIEGLIDRAYGLNRIFAKEAADGPYLEIHYEMGDYYSHDAEGQCTLRLVDGELVIEGAE